MNDHLRLQLFGAPALREGAGTPLRFRTRKQLALLVWLALEARDRLARRDLLVDLLWPGVEPSRGRHSLSQALSALRERLGPDALTRRSEDVRLLSPLRTELDDLREHPALRIEAGEPLAGMEDVAGAAFAHWVEGARTRLLRMLTDVLTDGIRQARAAGDLRVVRECAAHLYRVDPLSDIGVQGVAEQMLIDNDRPGAIRLLQSHAARTEEVLGCRPAQAVEHLLRRLEAGAVHTEGVTLRERYPPHAVPVEILLGRQAELARLEAAWGACRAGRFERLLIAGPAGIGKSALARRFITGVVARAWPAWHVACQEMGRNIPFAALSELIYLLCRDPSVSGTDPRWLSEASRVTPGLRARYQGVPEPSEMPPESVRLRVAEAIEHMLDAVAEGGPLLLVFDDVQHLDQASRDVLHVVARRLEGRQLLLVGTAQTQAGESLEDGDAATLHGFDWGTRIGLAPLDVDAVFGLVDHLCSGSAAPPSAVRLRIAELAQGNPYLVEMLVSDWRRNGEAALAAVAGPTERPAGWKPPRMMSAAFARQHERLSADALRLLQLLSVAGRRVPPGDAARLLGLDDAATSRATLELLERGIVHPEAGALGFKNDLHRAFAYHGLREAVRTFHHTRIAELLGSAAGSDFDFQRLLEASHHYVQAGMVNEAAEAACAGAEIALKRGAPKEAERALRGVLGTPTAHNDALRILLAAALQAEGRFGDAITVLDTCKYQSLSGRFRVLAAATRAAALVRGLLADPHTVNAASAEAYELAARHSNTDLVVEALQVRAETAAELGGQEQIQHVGALARGFRNAANQPVHNALAALTQAACSLFSGEPEDALGLIHEAIPCLREAGRIGDVRRARTFEGNTLWYLGRYAEATDAHEQAGQLASEVGDISSLISSWSNISVLKSDLGDYESAYDHLQRALTLAEGTGSVRRTAEVNTNIAALHIVLGAQREAWDALSSARNLAESSKSLRLLTDVGAVEVEYHLMAHAPRDAWQRFDELQLLEVARGLPIHDGILERLRRRYILAARGMNALAEFERADPYARRRPFRDRLILEALRGAAVCAEDGDSELLDRVVRELRSHGLPGVEAQLRAVGILGPIKSDKYA